MSQFLFYDVGHYALHSVFSRWLEQLEHLILRQAAGRREEGIALKGISRESVLVEHLAIFRVEDDAINEVDVDPDHVILTVLITVKRPGALRRMPQRACGEICKALISVRES